MPVVKAEVLTDGSVCKCKFCKKVDAEWYDEDLDVYLCAFCHDTTGECHVCRADRGGFYKGMGYLCIKCIQTIKKLNP